MGETNPTYPVREIALSLEDCAPHTDGTKERKLSGDIIVCRVPSQGIGREEAQRFLWLRLDGLEEGQFARLTDAVSDPSGPSLSDLPDGTPIVVFDKRRYCIPLDRLAQASPGFDVAQALDSTARYQPFLNVDEESPYLFLVDARPMDAHGLVFDKTTGAFL